jgi:hypothetical protein
LLLAFLHLPLLLLLAVHFFLPLLLDTLLV